ncbi:MAG: MHYT domain-containing protein [Asticcacaulis sp.]
MLKVLYCLRDQHDWKLVLLGGAVCLISCAVAILTLNRACATKGAARLRWVLTSGAATGFGIWATHFIAMLAFDPGVPLAFDPRLTLLSLATAMAITSGGVYLVVTDGFKGARITGGAVIGTAICTMHYLGMMALDVPGRLAWDVGLVAASLAAGIGLAATAMAALSISNARLADRTAGLLLVGAIVGHHFVAMGAVTIVPDPRVVVTGLALSAGAMSVAIALAAMVVLSLCIHAVVWGRKLDQIRADADRRFRVLLEGVEDYAIFMLDPDGLVMNWNAGGERINGYAPEDVVGRSYAEVCALDRDFARCYTAGLKVAEAEGRFEIEGPCKRASGEPFWSHTVIRPLRNDDGQLLGFANITQDITERKASEERICRCHAISMPP